MKPIFASIEKGDTLYIVYNDLNGEFKIGKGIVTGFHYWTYKVGDRYETWDEKDQTNILYEFKGIQFSRNLECSSNKTHFTDSPMYGENYERIISDKFVETFTTYDEAKEYIISKLALFINVKTEQINKLKSEVEKYNNNLIEITTKDHES